jgi:dipeptidyl aminopeptidase/acylaminoacyl peptidase
MRARIFPAVLGVIAALLAFAPPASALETTLASFSVAGAEGAVVSPDGSIIYVLNCTNLRLEKWTTTNPTLQGTLPLGGCGYNLAMTPDGSKLVVATALNNSIEIITTSNFTAVARLATTANPRSAVISPAGDTAFVALADGKIAKVSLTSNTIVSTTAITGAGAIFDIAATADGATLYLCTQNNRLMKVQTSNLSVLSQATLFQPCWFVALAPDESYAYTSYYSPSVKFERITTSTMTVAATITGTSNTAQGQFSKDGNYFYITNHGTGKVLKYRTSDNALVLTLSGSYGQIWHSAIDSRGEYLYVMSIDGTVYKIGADGAQVTATGTLTIPNTGTFRTNVTISMSVSPTGGYVTFYQNGKYIPGCQKVLASTSTVTCTFKPTVHGQVAISALYKVSGNTSTLESKYLAVRARTALR